VSGWITDLGEGVRTLKIGDLVVADSRASCGHCAQCLSGHHNRCGQLGFLGEVQDGGFAEQLCLSAMRVLRVPTEVRPKIAALSEPLAVALRVVRRLDPPKGAPIVIAGGGCIGGFTGLLLSELGFGPLYLLERNRQRADLLREVCGLQPITLDDMSFQTTFVVEATGSAIMLEQMINRVAPGGRIALVGLFKQAGGLDLNRVVEREIDLCGCSVFAGEQQEVIPLLPRLAPRLERVISEPIGLEALPEAYERLIGGGVAALKILISP